MRALVQRVKRASVEVEGKIVGKVGNGLLIFFATTHSDKELQISWLVNKIVNLRIFSDLEEKLNLSLKDIKGEALVVSQFTLYGNCLHGRRPSFTQAQEPSLAIKFYEAFIQEMKKEIPLVQEGIFGAKMEVSLINDGPVTFMIEAKE